MKDLLDIVGQCIWILFGCGAIYLVVDEIIKRYRERKWWRGILTKGKE